MQSVVAALEQHQAKARAAGTVVDANEKARLEGEGTILCELQELAERMACMAVDAQKGHPIGFRRYLRYDTARIVFFFFHARCETAQIVNSVVMSCVLLMCVTVRVVGASRAKYQSSRGGWHVFCLFLFFGCRG